MKKPISQDKLFEDCVKYLPAFPIVTPTSEGGHFLHWGMSLRDYFAGQALAGISANTQRSNAMAEPVSVVCYRIADAMLAEREK